MLACMERKRPELQIIDVNRDVIESDYRRNPDLSSFAEFWASIDPLERRVIGQYQEIAGAYDALWQVIYARTITKAWETDPKSLGSCAVSDEVATDGLDVIHQYEIIQLRNRRNNETPLNGKTQGCPHHRPNTGCILGDLKGPKCLDYVDMYIDDEIEERFGICLMPVKPYLLYVGQGGVDQSIAPWRFHPEANESFVVKTITAINQVREYVEAFPVLSANHSDDSIKL